MLGMAEKTCHKLHVLHAACCLIVTELHAMEAESCCSCMFRDMVRRTLL